MMHWEVLSTGPLVCTWTEEPMDKTEGLSTTITWTCVPPHKQKQNGILSLLKWTLGVRRRTAYIPIWGDTGRCPIAIEMTKLLVDYLNKLVLLDAADSPQIVRHAFIEQANLGLEWYTSTKILCERFDPNALKHQRNETNHLKQGKKVVQSQMSKWNSARRTLGRLTFCNLTKDELCYEPYLQLRDHKKVKTLAWLRNTDKLPPS